MAEVSGLPWTNTWVMAAQRTLGAGTARPPAGGAREGEWAMPRLRQVPKAEVTDELVLGMYERLFDGRDPVAEPGTATGTPGDWWTVFALVPDVFRHAVQGFGLYRSPDRRLDPQLRELGQTRAGWARGSQFVFSQHCKSCRSLGMSEEKIAAVPSWATATCFSPAERAVLAYTDAPAGSTDRGCARKSAVCLRILFDQASGELIA